MDLEYLKMLVDAAHEECEKLNNTGEVYEELEEFIRDASLRVPARDNMTPPAPRTILDKYIDKRRSVIDSSESPEPRGRVSETAGLPPWNIDHWSNQRKR